jgi:hypothetical protein
MTVLANEQVIDGRGWRSGALVEKRKLNQWFLKITDFADDLLEGLGDARGLAREGPADAGELDRQEPGPAVRFDLSDGGKLAVYTTRPDTIFGASFVAIAADHPLAQGWPTNPAAPKFIAECKKGGTTAAALETAEKLGFDTGIGAKHPFTGADLPVFIANFVLMEYGTGAVMGVPAHDQRDFDFATKYGLPILRVVAADPAEADAPFWRGRGGRRGDRELRLPDGMSVADAKAAVIARAEAEGWGRGKTVWRLRDWGVSRQRYWGTPIPFIHCDACGVVPVPKDQLPVVLPEDVASTCPATRWCATRPGSTSTAPSAASRRGARPTRSTPSSIPRGISCASPASRRTGRSTPAEVAQVAAGGAVYRRDRARDPAPALCPLLDPRAGPHRQDRGEGAFRQPVHAGHGDARDLQPRAGEWRPVFFSPAKSSARAMARR